MTAYEIKSDAFSGPLDKLLELIEAKSLDISQVSLAAVTDDFLAYLKRADAPLEPGALADFLVVAARLVLIKSRQLIPELPLTVEEEADMGDLEARLRIYRAFAARDGAASGQVRGLWNRRQPLFSRALLQGGALAAGYYPPKTLSAAGLSGSFAALASVLAAAVTPTGTIRRAVISIEEKISEILARCKTAIEGRFSDMTRAKPREEVVALFLALLHLLRTQRLGVEQGSTFGDIVITSVKHET